MTVENEEVVRVVMGRIAALAEELKVSMPSDEGEAARFMFLCWLSYNMGRADMLVTVNREVLEVEGLLRDAGFVSGSLKDRVLAFSMTLRKDGAVVWQ